MRAKVVIPLAAALLSYMLYMCSFSRAPQESIAETAASVRVVRELEFEPECVYAACLGEFTDAFSARAGAARYTGRGAAACVRATDGKWAVLAAAYDSDGEAQSACARLSASEGVEAFVRAYSAVGARLRVTAGETQLTAIEAALDVLDSCPDALNAVAVRLDDGTTDTATARALAAIALSGVETVRKSLEAELAGTGNGFCLDVISAVNALDVSLTAACAASGPSGLSLASCLRQICLETRLDMIDLQRGIA